MKRHILSSGCVLTFILVSLQAGCSKQETAQTAAPDATAVGQSAPQASEAEAVVSHFLDRIRRGGENHNAMALLTDRARSELSRIGQVVQPIGSPDAHFKITRSTPMPVDESVAGEGFTGRLVHCIWTEPAVRDASGAAVSATESYQVVWSVVLQNDGWKISGLVLEMSAQEPPLILDFENGEHMAKILGGQPAEQTAASPAQADASEVR
ncbi:hypothetical protein FHS27_006150 [Rhodopirellula rubra]|uniref:Uncharacterized protein n=1 Tax=Aporhodopirellula rubra TaxID=980271 RepID=A0A7W5E544_9BACT|nr:hypothetical protein [Aporhodopirellula rubra]MBB3210303.1 hypothetical protein [Aporhodopirellula rubra]